MKYYRLLAAAVVVPRQEVGRPFWGAQHLGAGSVVGVLKNKLPSPVTGDTREPTVRWRDAAGRDTEGWLAQRTPMDRNVPAKTIHRSGLGEDRVTAWDTLRHKMFSTEGWTVRGWLAEFGKKNVPLLHAVIRELGGRVPKSDDPTVAVRMVLRLITGKDEAITMATKETAVATPKASTKKASKKAASKTAAAKSTKKSAKSESNGPGRTSMYSGKTIVRLVKGNPRREDTHGYNSWNLLKKGMTYEQYIAAGGRRVDLAWDIMKGNVKLVSR